MTIDVMIVDDSAAIRKILKRILDQSGLILGNVIEAGDGMDALAKLREHPVNLILSDINMPNMDGIQLLIELKANVETKHVPVIMITTEGGQAKVMEAIHLGASGFIKKPFTSEQIREKVIGLFQMTAFT